jgi:hypothetical protein
MKTECVRCHKEIDTVQGYKFSPTEYLCMSCYDAYKAERAARARKQHKNPLIDQFGAEAAESALQETRPPIAPKPEPPPPQPAPPQAAPPQAAPQPPEVKPAPEPVRAAAPSAERAKPPPAQPAPAAEVCDVCKKPVSDFKVPLKGGKKVCWDCNSILREMAKSLILNVQCPHCGKEIQMAQD